MNSERVMEILVVDDSAADMRLVSEGLKECPLPYRLRSAGDGDKALELIFADDSPRPDLVILDLNMPKKSGYEVLAAVKGNVRTKDIPVVVFSSSMDKTDVDRVYDLSANSYVVKPLQLDEFIKAVRSIKGFWFLVEPLPTKRPTHA